MRSSKASRATASIPAVSKVTTLQAGYIIIGLDLALIIFATVLGIMKTGNPSRYFGEGRFTMALSGAQLLAVAFFTSRIYAMRRYVHPGSGLDSPRTVWHLISLGFVFLVCDEGLELHEKSDNIVMHILDSNSEWLERLDDVLVGFYGVIGLAVLWRYRREVLLFRRAMTWPLVCGFTCFAMNVVCDTASDGDAFLFWLTGDMPTAQWLNAWLSVGDGAFTLLAEGFFALAFYGAWRKAASLPRISAPAV